MSPAVAVWAEGIGKSAYNTAMTRLERITTDPAICHGKPTIRGLRYPVEMLLELLAAGMTIDEVLEDYRDLERDDLLAALEFGALTNRTSALTSSTCS